MQFTADDKFIEYLEDGNIRFSIACDKDNPMSLMTDILIKDSFNKNGKIHIHKSIVYVVKSVETKPYPGDNRFVLHKVIAERKFQNADSH